jgi:hypothetical protein
MYHEIDVWYDRSLRLWTCLWLDEEGYQVGTAQYAVRKHEKKDLVERMKVTDPCDYQV